MRRVAVTGLGTICALGATTADCWAALREGCSAIRRMELVDPSSLRFQNAAEVRGFDPRKHFTEEKCTVLDRFSQFALVAARQAISDSGLKLDAAVGERTAIVTGSCTGGQSSEDVQFAELYGAKSNRVHPLTIPRTMANAGASHISMEFGITGPAFTISTACSSANHAIGEAFCMVRDGRAELALAGGSEAPFSLGMLKAWEAMRVVAPDTCRPFSKDRQGMILGEGAAMLVLEPLEAARARGARVYGEIVGFGMSADAYHLTRPSADGAARAMKAALADASIAPEQVGYINAHGTGTPQNDVAETQAIRSVFGKHADRLAVSSTKSMHGHALGAAGALEAAATLLALHERFLPPTANFTTPDPQCDLDVLPNRGREAAVESALSNSFAFGGLNAVLAFRAAQ
ncbi:MAG: beta-ketoacyl-[acyl-carrier-protein] synthase family protein [Acidobacteriia bacterium]|nr:beta-ketoacyl-[acyl-carrier-protein] synthase family protein [Terriglobia bacterium]